MTPTLSDLIHVFGRIGCLSFGGPAAQIALMHRELVEHRQWISEGDYLRGLSFCMLLPGPEAMQLATYVGWKQRGIPGGLIAGGLFVLPGALVIFALAFAYGAIAGSPLAQAAFLGIKAAVVAIVIEAIIRVAKKALKSRAHWWIAGIAFLALFALGLPFPLVIAVAALTSWVTAAPALTPPQPGAPLRAAPFLTVVLTGGVLWAIPLLAAWATGNQFLLDLGLFFSQLAVVTFGGAYAVLAYMTQEVVQSYGWLTTGQMMDALGLAETTPGPLILVTQFVGVVAGIEQAGWSLGLLGGLMVLWVTFVPCFIWIFAGAPLIGWLEGRPKLSGALAGITAAVVGVILNLSLWFAIHVLFAQTVTLTEGPLNLTLPLPQTLNPIALALTAFAAWALLLLHWGLATTLALSAALGLAAGLVLP
jgi:chromate transporter